MADQDQRQLFDRLAQALQVAALTAQRIAVTSKQQQVDASQCVGAVERAVAELQTARQQQQEGDR